MSEYSTKVRPYIIKSSMFYSGLNYTATTRVLAYNLEEAREQFKNMRIEMTANPPPVYMYGSQTNFYTAEAEIPEEEKYHE